MLGKDVTVLGKQEAVPGRLRALPGKRGTMQGRSEALFGKLRALPAACRGVPAVDPLSEETPVSIPGLGEVAVRFFERNGFQFARFSLAPEGEGMLQQPPVMGPGGIDFPAAAGTYHLDVLTLDMTEKRANVRLRFSPA
jgi:hypothetical protein